MELLREYASLREIPLTSDEDTSSLSQMILSACEWQV